MLRRTAGLDDLRTGHDGTVPYRALLVALREFLRTEGEVHLDDPNVSSVGIGYKVTAGRRTPELCVQFTVVEKRADPEGLAALGTTAVPPAITIAGMPVPTDVVQCGPPPAGRRAHQIPAGRASSDRKTTDEGFATFVGHR